MANFYSLNAKKIPVGRGDVKSLVGGLLVPTLPNMEMGAGWLGAGWLLTNKMAFDNSGRGAWLILEILACDPGWLACHTVSFLQAQHRLM